MADFKIRSTVATLNQSTGTQNITLSGFGTPIAAIFYFGGAANGTQKTDFIFGQGFTDGTGQYCATISSADGLGASNTFRKQRNDAVIDILEGNSSSSDFVATFSAFIDDGVTINITTAAAVVRTVQVILIGGTDAANATVGSINLGTGTSAITETIGHSSDIIFTHGIGAGSYSSAAGPAIFGMGLYHNDGSDSQCSMNLWEKDSQNISNLGSYFSETKAALQDYDGTVSWQAAISNVTATSFDVTPSSSTGSDLLHYLSIEATNTPDISLDFLASPTSAGDFSTDAPAFTPDFTLLYLSDNTTADTQQTGEALTVAAFDSVNTFSLSSSSKFGQDNPTIANTEYNNSIAVLEDGNVDSYVGTFSSFDANGFTLNFPSTVAGSARRWAALTVGPAAVSDITMDAGAGSITVTGQDVQLISPATIATTTANLSAPSGHGVVTLSGEVTLDGGFTVQPIVGDQIIYPSVLTIDSQLNITGPSGVYVLYHTVASSGLTYHTSYTVSAGAGYTDSVTVEAGDSYTVATLATGFDTYIFEGWSPQPVAGQQLVTETGNGYFDNFGNYYSELEHVHDAWHIALDGTATHFTVDSTGLGTGVDTIPDAPVFTPLVGQAINTQIESNIVTITGITAATPITINVSANGEYAISTDAGLTYSAWLTTASTVQLDDRVKLRTTTPSGYLSNKIVTLNTNGISGNWSLTTLAADITPSDFTFTALTGQNVNTVVESNSVNILDVSAGYDVPVTISNGEWAYSTDDGLTYSSWSATTGVVRLGYRVKVRHTTSISYETETYTTIDIGTTAASFISTTITAALDISPDAFSFTDLIDQATNDSIESNALQITGLTAATDVSISVSGGEYAISTDGGSTYSSFTNTPGTIQNGNYLKLRITSSANYYIKSSVIVTIGTYSSTWSVTTLSLSIPQFNVNDPSVFVERFFGDSYRVRVIKGYDNWVKFECYNNGGLMNLSNGTDFKVIATDANGTEYTLNRVANPNYFTILASIGVIEIMLGQISAPVGDYDLDLVYFDALHTTGAVLTSDRQITLELV